MIKLRLKIFLRYFVLVFMIHFLSGGVMQMRYSWLGLTLFLVLSLQSTVGHAQTDPANGQSQKTQTPAPTGPGSEVPPDAAVITIDGLCDSGFTASTLPVPTSGTAGPSKAIDPGCKTVITRAQYEYLLGVLGAKPSAYHGLKFARRYAEVLLFSEKGRELGVEKDPKFQEKIRYNYLEALDQFTLARLQEQADAISDAEAAKYYKEHPERFVQSHILQISVPKHKNHDATPGATLTPSQDTAEQVYMHNVALTIQKEAVAGGDPEKLQEKAYKIAGEESVPDIDMGNQVPDLIPMEYRKLMFDLNAGQVSQIAEDDHEFLIFKCVEKHAIPPSEAKRFAGWLRMRDSKTALRDSVKTQYNQQYFPTASVPAEKEADVEKTP